MVSLLNSHNFSLNTTRSRPPVPAMRPRTTLPTKMLPSHYGKRSPVQKLIPDGVTRASRDPRGFDARAIRMLHWRTTVPAPIAVGRPAVVATRRQDAEAIATHGAELGGQILLFVRARKKQDGLTMPYKFLGPVDYVSHKGERPIAFTWQLRRPMPADFFRAAKVASA